MNPTVSVITVSYNTATSLEKTIQSVLNQRDVVVEYIIIDGGSTDGTATIIDRYRDRLAYYISEPDLGVYDAMNKGLAKATGDWVFFIGADDRLTDEHTFGRIWAYLANNNLDWRSLDLVFGDVHYLNGSQLVRRYRSRFDASMYLKNRLHHQGAFYRRRSLADWHYDANFRAFADYELNLKLYLAKIRAIKIPSVVAECQVGGISGRVLWSGWQEEMAIRRRHLGWWSSLPWDACGALRYGIKQVQQFSARRAVQ
jgi:putative colanic acid biosynthesis glycosyltransferase